MAKMDLKIGDISYQHSVKKVRNASTRLKCGQDAKVDLHSDKSIVPFDISHATTIVRASFEAVKKIRPLLLSIIGGILIILLSITGCSDTAGLGPMLTPDDVDRYIVSAEDSFCVQSGSESACVTLVPAGEGPDGPIFHVRPRRIVYVLYRDGVPVVRAETARGTDGDGTGVRGVRDGTGTNGTGTDGTRDDGIPGTDGTDGTDRYRWNSRR